MDLTIKFNRSRWYGLFSLLLALGWLAIPANADPWTPPKSSGFQLWGSSTDSGGTETSDQFNLKSVVGEVTLGPQTTSANFQQWPGFRLPNQDGAVQFNQATYTVNESTGLATITVTRVGGRDRAASVKYTTSDGTALAGQDYTAASGTLNWNAGDSTAKTFTINIADDNLHETRETVTLTLSEASAASLGSQKTATLTITDKGAKPTVSLVAQSQTLSERSGTSTLTVITDVATTEAITVHLNYGGTASQGTDYTGAVPTVTINAGSTSSTVTLTAIDDGIYEGAVNETIVVEITHVSGGGAHENTTPQTQTVTITEGTSAPLVSLSTSTESIAETTESTIMVVQMSSATSTDVTILLSFGGTATSNDYHVSANTITIPAGSTTGTVRITSISDQLYDPGESIIASISQVSGGGAVAIAPQFQTFTLIDPFSAPIVSLDISTPSMSETSGTATVTANLSVATTKEVTVIFSYANSTALKGSDFTGATSVTIPAGTTQSTMELTSVSDNLYDPNETVVIAISHVSGGGASADDNQSQSISIIDDEVSPTVSLSTSSPTLTEVLGASTVTVALSVATTTEVNVTLSYLGTATSGVDYHIPATSITIGAGAISNTLVLTAVDDTLHEGDETILIEIASVSGGGASEQPPQSAPLILTDNESRPTVTLSSDAIQIAETSGSATVTVALSHASTSTVTINFSYSQSTAIQGTDFSGTSSLIIPIGSTTNTLTLSALHDTLHEGQESIVVDISTVSGADEKDNQTATLFLIDDEGVPTVMLSAEGTSMGEASGQSVITASLSHASTSAVTVQLGLSGTASLGTDYRVSASSITIHAGSTTGAMTVTSLSDSLDEMDETIAVTITEVIGAVETPAQTVTIDLIDDDAPPSVTMEASRTSLTEIPENTVLDFMLDAISTKEVTIAVNLTGTATEGADYTISSKNVTISPGNTTGVLTITSVSDTELEDDETIVVDIEASNAIESEEQQQTITILDDDVPSVHLSVDNPTISEQGESALVTARLNRSFKRPVTVNLSLSGSASANDYSHSNNPLLIDAGATTEAFRLTATSDDVDETDETVTITISELINGVTETDQVTVTITDDDTAGITVSPISGNTSEDGATATFTVALATEPTAGVTIGVSSGDITEGTASPSALTFQANNWNVPQTVTVRGLDDLQVDPATSYTILLAAAMSTDNNYAGLEAADVTLVNEDNEIAGFIVSEVQGALKEDANTPSTASFTIRLKTIPLADVTLDLRLTDTTEGSFSATEAVDTKSLTITPDNWQVERTITVFSVDDSEIDGDVAFQVLFENLVSEDNQYTVTGNAAINLSALTRSLTTLDNDSPGLIVGTVSGNTSEDGRQSASVQVSLKSQPSGHVTVSVASSDTGEVTVSPATLTFTLDNWAALQTVQLTGVNDNEVDGAQTVTITFQADAAYNNVTDSATVINDDDDMAALVVSDISGNTTEDGRSASFTVRLATQPEVGETVTVALASSDPTEGQTGRAQVVFTPDNWNSDQTLLVFGVDDGDRDGKVDYTINLNTQSSLGTGAYQGLSHVVTVSNEDDEVVGVVLSPVNNPVDENGRTATFEVHLQLAPTAEVTIQFVSLNANEGTVSPAHLTFTPENWKASQTVTVTGVRGTVGVDDGDQTFVVQLSMTSVDTGYASLEPSNVTVVNLDVDQAGIVQSAVTGEPTEEGDIAEFSLSLLSAPQGNVVIEVSSSNEAEGKATPAQLTFTPSNWNAPQKIAVQGQNEAMGADILDGPQQFFVHMAINPEQTTDTAYDVVNIDSVEFFNQDNDSAGFVVSEMTGPLQENGLIPQSFTVKLTSQPANSSLVTVALRSSDSSEGRLETSTLTFTVENWSSEHKVNVFGVDDNGVDGDQRFFIQFDQAQSNDSHYLITPPSVSVVNEDDDQARVIVSSLDGTAREDGSTASVKVRLGTPPSGNVVIHLAVVEGSTDEVSVSRSTLTFTDKNWNADHTVVVTGLADGVADGDQIYTITMTMDSSTADANYANLNLKSITGVNEDVDVAGLVFSETNDNTSEDGTHSRFTLRLRSQPTGVVHVHLSVTDTNEAQLPTSMVTFDDKTWSAHQTISLQGLDDDRQDDDQRYYVELTVADSSTDTLYKNLPVARVPFINEDNDVSKLIVSPLNQNTREDGTAAEFKVRLSTIPDGDVSLAFQLVGSASSTPTLNDEVTLSTASLTFTPENWKADQRVVLRGVDDEDTDGDQSFVITFNAAQSPADTNYQGQQLDPLQGVNEDDDIAEFVVEPLSRNISEEGSQSFFRLRLRSRPAEGSTVQVSFQATGEDTALPTLSANELEFTRTNWQSWQKVIVTGQDDEGIDGDQPFKIVFAPVVSADPNYTGFVIPSLDGVTHDNDSGGISVSALSGNVTEQRQQAFFTLRLRSQPTSPVTVQMSIEKEFDNQGNEVTGEGELISGNETVVFTPSNWNAEQTVRVAGINDNFKDGDQRFRVLFDSVTSEDSNYHGLELDPITGINEDDDISGFVLSEISRPVREDGTTAIFEISLRSRPLDENQGGKTVQVNLTSSDTTEGTVEPSSITFTSDDWRAKHRVRVFGVDDTEGHAILDGDQTFRIDFSAAVSEDADYHGQIPDSVDVVNIDEDVPEFIVSPVSGQTSEDGDRATFTVRLRTQPESSTTVILPIESSHVAEATVVPTQLAFTADNYSSPQTVTLVGVDDMSPVQDGDQAYTIRLNAAVAEGSVYQGVDPDDIDLSNKDNESAGFVISEITGNVSEDGLEEYISVRLRTQPTANVVVPVRSSQPTEGKAKVTTLTFTPTNWSADQIIGVVGQDEANLDAQVADGNQPFRILLAPEVDPENANCVIDPSLAECRLTVTSDDPNYNGLVAGEVSVINQDNDYQGLVVGELSGNVSEEGGQQTFFVRLRSNPQNTVFLNLSTTDAEEVTVSPITLTYNADNWRGQQVVTVTGVDDSLSDGDQLTTIRVDVASSSSAYTDVLGEEVEVLNEDNDVADVLISAVKGKTGEDGSVATFTVRLQSQPTNNNDVTIHLTSSDAGEGTVFPASLTFSESNWDAWQTVRMTGIDDTENDGDVSYQITLQMDASSDASYQNIVMNPVEVTNVDDEKPGFIVTSPSNATREDGTQASFHVRLSSPPSTGNGVSVSLESSRTNEGQVFPHQLFFDENNWNANQVVTIIGQDDESSNPGAAQSNSFFGRLLARFFRADTPETGTKDGDQSYQVVFGAAESDDSNYSGITPDQVRMTNEDDDTAGYILSDVEGTINENGSQGQFTVELRTNPTDTIVIEVTSSDVSEGIVSPARLEFTPANWNAARTVTITGVNDELLDGSRPFEIRLNVARAGSDTDYATVVEKSVAVVNEDNDSAGLVISAIRGQAIEDGSISSFTVSLQSQPTAAVQVDVSSGNVAELVVSPSTLPFDASNWDVPQTITLTGQDESVKDGDQTVRIHFDTSASADTTYQSLVVPFMEATNEDNDIADFLISDLSLNQLSESDTVTASTFTLKLKTQPTDDVGVALGLSKGKADELTVSTSTLTFTPHDWNENQTVRLTAQDDQTADGNQLVRIVGTTTSNDPNYDNRIAVNLSLVNLDNDSPGVVTSPSVVSMEEGGTNTFTVQLATEPAQDVVLTFASSDTSLGALDTTPADTSTKTHTLTFSQTHWDTPQTVQLYAGEITNPQNPTFTVTITSVSNDENYNNLSIESIPVTVNAQASLNVTPQWVTVHENGSTATFAISLGTLPTADVTLNLSVDETEASLSSGTLTFTSINGKEEQTVVVTGVDDVVTDGTVDSVLQISVVTADANYATVAIPTVTVQTEDNDSGGFTVGQLSRDTLTEANADSASFTVKLSSAPTADVTIGFSSTNTAELSITESVTFTTNNWSIDQTVTLTVVDDVIDDGDQSLLIVGTVTTADPNYATIPFPSVVVTTIDDDTQQVDSGVSDNSNRDQYSSSTLALSVNWDSEVSVGDQSDVGVDLIREYVPADGASSDINQTTIVLHRKTVDEQKAGLEGIVEPKLVNTQSTVYLEGSANGFVSDAAAFVGTKLTNAGTVQASINFEGGIEIAITPTHSNQTVLLPEMALGANAVISETGGVVVEIALPDNLPEPPRMVGAVDTTRWYFMGRDLENHEVVYLRGKSGAKIKIIRELNESTTLIQITEGTVEVRIGSGNSVEKGVGEDFRVTNKAYEFTIHEGSNLIAAGVNSPLSPAELEMKLRKVHSIWRWNHVGETWQVYSPQVPVNQKLTEGLGISGMTTDVQASEGMWIYSEVKSTYWMHDKDYVELKPDLSLKGWYLLGNNSGQPIRVADFFSSDASITSLWLVREFRWQIYATDPHIERLVNEHPDVDLLSDNDTIAPGQAFWVNTGGSYNSERTTRLTIPPGGVPPGGVSSGDNTSQ